MAQHASKNRPKLEKKTRHLKLIQPEIDDRVPTILCENYKHGDLSTKMINSKHSPITCKECLAKLEAKNDKEQEKISDLIHKKKGPGLHKDFAAQLSPAPKMNEPLQSMGADWEATWTAKRAEGELIGFKFLGLGWYITKCKSGEFDTMLVLPYGMLDTERPFPGEFEPDGTNLYKFYVYNARNPAETFNWIVAAPVRQDERV